MLDSRRNIGYKISGLGLIASCMIFGTCYHYEHKEVKPSIISTSPSPTLLLSIPLFFPNLKNVLAAKENMEMMHLTPKFWWGIPFEKCWEKSCIVDYDPGGAVADFYAASDIISKRMDVKIIINGDCISACTLLSDMNRNQVCITPEAKFRYHTTTEEEIPFGYSQWTMDWVNSQGGFPSLYSGNFLDMKYDVAKNHWKTCDFWDIKPFITKSFSKEESFLMNFPVKNLLKINIPKEKEYICPAFSTCKYETRIIGN